MAPVRQRSLRVLGWWRQALCHLIRWLERLSSWILEFLISQRQMLALRCSSPLKAGSQFSAVEPSNCKIKRTSNKSSRSRNRFWSAKMTMVRKLVSATTARRWTNSFLVFLVSQTQFWSMSSFATKMNHCGPSLTKVTWRKSLTRSSILPSILRSSTN